MNKLRKSVTPSANTVAILVLPVNNRDHIQGSETATTTLVEYGDYQCSRCAEMHQIIQNIQQQLGERLRFVFRHFPCRKLHPYSQKAAETAEAAASQGKFWEMHDCLFRSQPVLDNGSLVECALKVDLDISQFLQELSEGIHADRVECHLDSGVQSGVKDTPTFFINGLQYEGAYEQSLLLAAIINV